jgi:hypothetical protein
MKYARFNVAAEVRKFVANKPTKVEPALLLYMIGQDYLNNLTRKRGANGR